MMTKLIALVNLAGLFLFEVLFLAEIRITQEVPAMMQAGEEVKVTVTIEKGGLGGFAKLQLDLPPGMSATAIETKGASFTFADQKAKFIWMALPSQPKFNVTYTLTADAGASGSMNIGGRFSYIEENERKSHDLETTTVQVSGAPAAESVPANEENTAAPSEEQAAAPESVGSFNDVVTAAGAAPVEVAPPAEATVPSSSLIAPQDGKGNVSCSRTITAITENEMLVEVVVHKGDIRGFGKLQELIPAGFSALEKTSDEAIFTTQGTVVKFVWLNLPARSDLKVVYKLRNNGQPAGDYVLNGEFGYLLNDETQKAVLGSTTFPVGPNAMIAQNTQQPQDTQAVNAGQEPQSSGTESAQEVVKPKGRIPAPETGVTYKVQITAAHKEVGAPYFAERHKFTGDFGMERHEGWIKYTTGRFGQYREARDQRQGFVSAGHNFPGPFVTAYNNGERITVQEALMISSQKWVQ